MTDKKISELDLALLINDDAEFPFSQDNAGEPTTFKGRITQLGTKIAEDMTFSNLQTTSKKLVGAINELLSLGSPIIIGTTAPTSSIGADGNIYVQYTAGTGGADDEVDGIYVKIDGAWCEIQTGGGGGTTDYEDLSNKPKVNSVELVGNKSLDDLGIMPASLSKTVSGSIVHITDGGDNIPVKSLVSEIVAVQSGSGTPSPSNQRAITGFDNGIITRCGINLWDEVCELGTIDNVTGAKVSANNRLRSKNYIRCLPNTNYFAKLWNNTDYGVRLFFYDNAFNFINSPDFAKQGVFTTPNNATYILFILSTAYGTTYNNDISINYPSTDTQYHAYNGNTYTFTFGQTVYGGHFDNKGNLVVTHVLKTPLSTQYSRNSAKQYYTSIFSDIAIGEDVSCLSDKFRSWDGSEALWTDGICFVTAQGRIRINTTEEYASVSDMLADCGTITFCCKLATPITLAISSQDIPTLLGENNIFSNCGDLEVDYYTDNADEIVKVAKATASTPLHNYSTDEQIVGTWIDGSTLYEKVFVSTTTPMASTWTDISLGDVNVIDFKAYFRRTGGFVDVFDGTGSTLVGCIRRLTNDTVFEYKVESAYITNYSNITIIVRYTKSST